MRRLLFRSFKPVVRLSRWFETRLTPTGKFVAAAAMAAALFGLDMRQTFAHQLALFCLVLLLVGRLCSLRFRPEVNATRVLPDVLTCGQSTRYLVHLENHGKRQQAGLILRDCLEARFPDFAAFASTPVQDTRARNRLDRAIGYLRLLDVLKYLRGASIEQVELPTLLPGRRTAVYCGIHPLRRGEIVFSHMELLCPDPLGLWYARVRLPARARLVALPALLDVPVLELRSSRRYQPGGVQLAVSVGESHEFTKLREYRPGDPLRDIHWRSLAKLNEPIVKEYEDEYFDRHAVLVDTFVADRPAEVMESIVRIAASFAAQRPRQDSLLDLMLIGRNALHLTSGRGRSNTLQILTALALADASEPGDFEAFTRLVRRERASISSAVCIFGHWDAERAVLVEELRAGGAECLCLLVAPTADAAALPADRRVVLVPSADPQPALLRLRVAA